MKIKKYKNISAYIFWIGIITILIAGHFYSLEQSSYLGERLGKFLSKICIYEVIFSFFIFIGMPLLTKLNIDKDMEYIVRAMLAFQCSFVVILTTITLHFEMSNTPIVFLFISLFIFTYLVWTETPKKEFFS